MKPRTKVIFVIENRGYGGDEKAFSLLIRGLPKEKFGVYCAGLPSGRFYDEVKSHCRFFPLELGCRLNLANIGKLRKLMAENEIDIAHSRGACADFFCALAASKAGVKAVSTLYSREAAAGGKISSLLNSLAAGRTAAAVTACDGLAAPLRGAYRCVKVIPNPLDLDEFDPSNFDAAPVIERYGLRGRTVISALGRLERGKGHSCLLSALSLALGKEPGLKEKLVCLLAGAGSLESRLKRQAAESGLSGSVVFCGEITDVRDFLAASDIFVMPSLAQGQPLALLEAMAMEKPVVASDLPGIRETAAGGAGAVLVRPSAPGELAEALLGLLGDMPAALALGRRARENVKGYSLPEYLRRHEELYSGMMAGGAR